MQKLLTLSEIKVSYHPVLTTNPFVLFSLDAYVIFKDFFQIETIGLQESFVVMYLNRASRVLGVYPICTGGITSTIADLRLLMSVALKIAATSIILCHNHPFRNLKPFMQDLDLTKKIVDAGRYFLIKKNFNISEKMYIHFNKLAIFLQSVKTYVCKTTLLQHKVSFFFLRFCSPRSKTLQNYGPMSSWFCSQH